MVPDAAFTSYYGRPILKAPTWAAADIAGYLFLGGLAGGSSIVAAGADLTGRHRLARATRVGALAAVTLSGGALVHDLGRPSRFYNMLRVFKPTSPMSVGSWVLTGYAPLAAGAAASDVLGRLPRVGRAFGIGAALVAPALTSYTAVLLADTAVPAWHEAYPDLPFAFVGSSAASAAGLSLLTVPAEAGPARRLALFGGLMEIGASRRIVHRTSFVAQAYRLGRADQLLRAAEGFTALGIAGGFLGRYRPWLSRLAGLSLLAGGACERFGLFEAGVTSAKDPKYVVVPQVERVSAGRPVRASTRPEDGGFISDGVSPSRRRQS
jgi:Polysulphide reductase, NrfD